jgi:tetratricopeptide (TPR) repeat protein
MSFRGSPFARGLIVSISACVLAVGACATAPKTPAKTPARQVLDLNKRALRAYQSGDLDNAKELLLRAIGVGTDAGLGDHNAMARTYLNLGAVYLRQEERDRAIGHLVLAMRIQPEIEPSSALNTTNMRKAMTAAKAQARKNAAELRRRAAAELAERKAAEAKEEARISRIAAAAAAEEAAAPPPPPSRSSRAAAAAAAPAPAPALAVAEAEGEEEPDMPATMTKPLHCPTADEAPPESPIPLRCMTRPGLPVARVLLYYRSAGSETFTAVPMVRSPKGWYQGVVPAKAVIGKSLQYYVEAEDPSKKVSTTNGDAGSPNLMIIREGAPKVVGLGPLAAARMEKKRARAAATSADAEVREEENPLLEQDERLLEEELERSDNRRSSNAWWISAGIGTGFGWHPRRNLEFRNTDAVETGFSPGKLLHLAPEVGLGFGGHWAVSLQTRHQIIPETGSGDDKVGAPKHSAHAVLARIQRYFGGEQLHYFASATLGFGEGFRLVVPPHPEVGVNRNDTIRGGPLVLGPGGGVIYHFGRHVAWGAEFRVLVGVPDIASIAEITTGPQVAF